MKSWLGMQVPTKNGQQLHLKPHSGDHEIQWQEKMLSTGKALENIPGHQLGWAENGP